MANGLQDGVTEYRSPVRKLARFFEGSRDKWKRKCQEAKKRNKLLSNQVRAVEKSRQRWRWRANQLQSEVRQLQQELAEQKRVSCGQ
jgi:seryl-tRNA synthetase